MARKNPPRRGLRPKSQVPGTLNATISHIRPEEDTMAGSRQRHPSTGQRDGQSLEELRALRDELREIVTEAHGLLKDLRIETRQARRLIPMIVTKRINTELTRQLEEMGNQVEEAMRQAVAKVTSEFDRLSDAFLGKDKHAKKAGLPPLEVLVNDAVEAYKFGPILDSLPTDNADV